MALQRVEATLEHARDWLYGTPAGEWTSMAVVSDGSYGVPAGLVSSFPVTCAGRAAVHQTHRPGRCLTGGRPT